MAKEEIYVDVGFWGGVVPGNEVKTKYTYFYNIPTISPGEMSNLLTVAQFFFGQRCFYYCISVYCFNDYHEYKQDMLLTIDNTQM